MSATLIDSVRSAFTTDIVSKISVLLGETENAVQKGINGAIPLVLTDILHKSSYPESVASVRELSRRAVTGDFFGEMHELSTNPGGLVPGSVLLNRGVEYAKELLRLRYDGVVSEVSRFATISLPSAAFITGVVSFAALDSIGRYLGAHNVETQGLSTWIKTHSDGIRAAVPAGLEVRQALGIQHYPWETRTAKKSRSNALVAVLVLIIVVVGAFFAYRYHEQHPTVFAPTNDSLAPASATAPAARDTVPARSN
jgi:hypothetical protein